MSERWAVRWGEEVLERDTNRSKEPEQTLVSQRNIKKLLVPISQGAEGWYQVIREANGDKISQGFLNKAEDSGYYFKDNIKLPEDIHYLIFILKNIIFVEV